jgi:preprotein translocase subunit SecG
MLLFFIIIFTVIMVLDCVLLCFLVLMQLPKKEAGAALAFGAPVTDALFGAGSGNFLTKATKYCAGIFFVLAIALSLMQTAKAHQQGSAFMRKVQEQQNAGPGVMAPSAPPVNSQPAPAAPTTPTTSTPGTNDLAVPPVENTSAVPHLTIPTNPASAPATH